MAFGKQAIMHNIMVYQLLDIISYIINNLEIRKFKIFLFKNVYMTNIKDSNIIQCSRKQQNTKDTFRYLYINKTKCIYNIFVQIYKLYVNKGNNKITELRTILQRESKNS
jgi:hypothetical protein